MDPQGALVDDRVGPDAADELVLENRLAGALDQGDQDIERAAAEPQRLPVVKHQLLRGDQPKRPKGEDRVIHRRQRDRRVSDRG